MIFTNIGQFEKTAREKLDRVVYDYYAGGADDEQTLRENHSVYGQIALQYRVLRGISEPDTRIRLLGQNLEVPIVVAPTAFHGMANPDGEVATARAAGKVGTVMILSTLSNRPMEAVAEASRQPVWFQLYVYKDRATTEALIRRAEASGCQALVLTVDAPAWGKRERDIHNRFQLPQGLRIENIIDPEKDRFPEMVQGSGLTAYVSRLFKMDLAWEDVDWLCGQTRLPVFLKGIVHPQDAVMAVEHGAAGVVVSNHGGRQLDTAPATAAVLPAIAEAVDRRIVVMVDGGIRRGTDVIKALALGADAVAVGRPVLWGLAAGGSSGVEQALLLIIDEFRTAMILCGCRNVADIKADLLLT